jgi:hypothetical protein
MSARTGSSKIALSVSECFLFTGIYFQRLNGITGHSRNPTPSMPSFVPKFIDVLKSLKPPESIQATDDIAPWYHRSIPHAPGSPVRPAENATAGVNSRSATFRDDATGIKSHSWVIEGKTNENAEPGNSYTHVGQHVACRAALPRPHVIDCGTKRVQPFGPPRLRAVPGGDQLARPNMTIRWLCSCRRINYNGYKASAGGNSWQPYRVTQWVKP